MAKVTDRRPQTTDHRLFQKAKRYIPGGVNSPVRSFRAVGGFPVFVKSGNGSRIYGENGKEYIDYCLSWGALILGHAHKEVIQNLSQAIKDGTSFGTVTKLESELAALIAEAVPSIERIRLTNSGTEAVMGAVRLARAYTKKDKIIKFEGSYHGHADYLLVKGGSGQSTLGIPTSLGVPQDFTKHTVVLQFNSLKEVEGAIEKFKNELAAIIVEPVAANCGVILPKIEFLNGLRRIADRYGIVLIFDEVITGFRLSYGGAQSYFNVKPDLTCLGKVIGGGLPIGAFGGKKEIMELLAPQDGVYQAGTLSGNPIAVTAGLTTLRILKKHNPYGMLERKTKNLCEGIRLLAKKHNINLKVNYIRSIFSIFFIDKEVTDYRSANLQDLNLFKRFFHILLKNGIYYSPSGFEANFLSVAHTAEDIDKSLEVIDKAFKHVKGAVT